MPGADDLVETEGAVGTPAFMSPEQFRDPAKVGPASDFFSLGATAFHLLTGERPFEAGSLYETHAPHLRASRCRRNRWRGAA